MVDTMSFAKSFRPMVRPRCFTSEEYHRMADAGILAPDERVELLDGVILAMPVVSPAHAACVSRLNMWFQTRLDDRAQVRVHGPLRLGTYSEPEPDLMLLKVRDDFYESGHPEPSDVLLLIEVSDLASEFDRSKKVPAYAAAGVSETWLFNARLKNGTVYRDPSPAGYRATHHIDRDFAISPLAFPDVTLRWEDVFGRTR
jgi:Uma2 family endonuclease